MKVEKLMKIDSNLKGYKEKTNDFT